VLLLAVMAFVAGRSDYLDLALAYALINFIGVLAVLEFFRQRKGSQLPYEMAAQMLAEEAAKPNTAKSSVNTTGERSA
jgi:multicomponent Na+:H+ antiporter subunit F